MSTPRDDMEIAADLLSKYQVDAVAFREQPEWKEIEPLVRLSLTSAPTEAPRQPLDWMASTAAAFFVVFYRGYLAGLEQARGRMATVTFVVRGQDDG